MIVPQRGLFIKVAEVVGLIVVHPPTVAPLAEVAVFFQAHHVIGSRHAARPFTCKTGTIFSALAWPSKNAQFIMPFLPRCILKLCWPHAPTFFQADQSPS